MKKISNGEAEIFQNSAACIVTEYGLGDQDLNISTAVISGRYPDQNYCTNLEVKELVFVLSGSGEIFKADETISFDAGDAILIDKNEKYF